MKQYLQLPHALILTGDGHQAMVDRPLAQLGLKRRVALRIPFFISAVFAAAQTDLILTVPRTLAKITAPMAGLRMIEPPREIRAFPYFMSWHPRLTSEAAHVWLREQVRAAAQTIAAVKPESVLKPRRVSRQGLHLCLTKSGGPNISAIQKSWNVRARTQPGG